MYLDELAKNDYKFMIRLVIQKIDRNQANKQDLKHQCCNWIEAITVIYCFQRNYSETVRGSVDTQTAMLNVKLTLILKTHPPSLLTSVVAY